jgi:hypothetical protein
MTELEAAGIGFEIDHYLPKEKFPELISQYHNLMWSCRRCNRSKSDYSPDAEDDRNGYVVLRIDECDPRDHLESDHLFLKGRTTKGQFNIELLDLNRKQLRQIRECRERLFKAAEYIAFGVQQLMSMNLDRIPPRNRVPFQKIRRYILDRKEEVSESIESLLREFAHSELLDIDPEQEERRKKAKRYLREIRAIVPERDVTP